MPIASVKTYLDQIEEPLRLAGESLDEPQLLELQSASRERRVVAGDSTVEQISTQLVAVLTEADANLEPGQIEALDAHVGKRLGAK